MTAPIDTMNDSEKCEMCGKHYVEHMLNQDMIWIGCEYEPCSKWYHIFCKGITPDQYETIKDNEWFCSNECQQK